MNHREGTFKGAGGVEIYRQDWSDDSVPTRGVIVLAHGASEHSGRYGNVLDRVVPLGFPVYALDHRGHGRSEGKPALIDRLGSAIADIDTVVDQAKAEHPDVPLFLLGHSMGGCLAIEYTLHHQAKLDALILSAPLAALEAASPLMRVAARALSAVAPNLPLIEVDAGAISRDPAEVAAYESDPLVYRGKLPVRTVAELAKAIDTFPERVPAITIPLLIVHGWADRLVPIEGSEMVFERAASEDKTIRKYEGLYHELFNELPEDREIVLEGLAEWLEAHAPAPAPGA